MVSLISDIQRGAIDESIQIEALLRKVKLAAAKLNLNSLEEWVEHELNGYVGEVPDYRVLHGQPAAWNPYNGWIPIQSSSSDFLDIISKATIRQSVGSLRDLTERKSNDPLHLPINNSLVAELNKIMNFETSRMVIQLPRGAIVMILERVRNKVLDWAIAMERTGVVGEGMSFGESEARSARAAMTTFNIGNIGNFSGNLGVDNKAENISLQSSDVAEVLDKMARIKSGLPELMRSGANSHLPEVVDEMIVEAQRPAPNRGKLQRLAEDARSALTSAAGNLTSDGASALIGQVVKLLAGGS